MADEQDRGKEAAQEALCVPRFEDLVAPVALPRKRPPLPAVLGGVVACVVAIVLVATIAVVRPFTSLRASDYASGASRVEVLQDRYEAVSSSLDQALAFLLSQSSQYDSAAVANVSKYTGELRKSIDSFGRLKVANKDEQVNAAYTLYERQAEQFIDFANNLAKSTKVLSQVKDACDDTVSGTAFDEDYASEYEQYVAVCRTSVSSLTDAPSKVVTEFATTLSNALDQTSDVLNQLNDIGSPVGISTGSATGQQLAQLSSQLVDLDIPSMFSEFYANKLQQTRDSASPAKLLERMQTALEQGYESASKK